VCGAADENKEFGTVYTLFIPQVSCYFCKAKLSLAHTMQALGRGVEKI
jgi:hypothetical protein